MTDKPGIEPDSHAKAQFIHYFAYGSNMSSQRLRARVPSARSVSTACLTGHKLCFHKVGRDGSAKCDAFATGDGKDEVIGVLFTLPAQEKPSLDAAEGLGRGYDLAWVAIRDGEGNAVEAFTYRATSIDRTLQPYHWYKEHVLRGCQEHRLPDRYIATVRAVVSVDDPDSDRAQREQAIHD